MLNKTEDMTFGMAIEALKNGHAVARKGWNGKDAFIYLTTGSDWLASQTDMLSEDWYIVA